MTAYCGGYTSKPLFLAVLELLVSAAGFEPATHALKGRWPQNKAKGCTAKIAEAPNLLKLRCLQAFVRCQPTKGYS